MAVHVGTFRDRFRAVAARWRTTLVLGLAVGALLVCFCAGAANAHAATPSVSTGTATSVEPTGALLEGSVNPNGTEVRSCYAQYGLSSSYFGSLPCEQSAIGAGNAPVAVSARVTRLQPGSAYHF